MELVKLSLASKLLPKAWKIYQESFPKDEQRPQEKQARVMRLPNYSFYGLLKDFNIIALFEVWEFENFLFIEHMFCNDEETESKMLKGYVESAKKSIIIQTHTGTKPAAKNRIKFYERIGFRLNNYNYTQPAYSPEQKPVKMKIASFPGILTPTEFEEIRKEIHRSVYELEKPLLD